MSDFKPREMLIEQKELNAGVQIGGKRPWKNLKKPA